VVVNVVLEIDVYVRLLVPRVVVFTIVPVIYVTGAGVLEGEISLCFKDIVYLAKSDLHGQRR
jgi:hypothetical protein